MENMTICHCRDVSYDDIVQAIVEKGAHSVQDLMKYTLAGTGCGFCRTDLEEILTEFRKK